MGERKDHGNALEIFCYRQKREVHLALPREDLTNDLRVNVLPRVNYTGIHLIIKATGTYIFIQNFKTFRKYDLYVLYSKTITYHVCV